MAQPRYAAGKLAWGICQRCGLRSLLNELRFDGYYPNIRVHYECYEPKHPQEKLVPLMDPTALWKPSPEQPNGPGPVLSGSISGSGIQLNWTHPDTLGARYERYTLFRQLHNADDWLPIFNGAIVYDFDMTVLADPLAFLDNGVDAGVTYDYQVFAYDDYNRGVQSNIVTLTASAQSITAPVLSLIPVPTDPFSTTLSWTASVSSAGISEYDIYVQENGGGFQQWDFTDPGTLTYLFSNMDPSSVYDFYVIAIDNDSNTAQSNTVSVHTPDPLSVLLYQDWLPSFAQFTGSTTYAPALAAAGDGTLKPYLIVMGQITSGDPPFFTYGGNNPDGSVGTPTNGALWVYFFDLTANPPVNDVLTVVGGSNAEFNALVIYNVKQVLDSSTGILPTLPAHLFFGNPPFGCMGVAVDKSTFAGTPNLSSSDGAAFTTTLGGNPFSNGKIAAGYQSPAAGGTLTYTFNTTGGALYNAVALLFKPVN